MAFRCWFSFFLALLSVTESHYTANEEATRARLRDAFYQSRLVPDVVDSFDPQASLILQMEDNVSIRHPGQRIKFSATRERPVVQLLPAHFGRLDSNARFTLMMVNPDFSGSTNHSGSKLNLLGTNVSLQRIRGPIEAYVMVNESKFIVDYRAPTPSPNMASFRYALFVYQGLASSASLSSFQDPQGTYEDFNVTKFTSDAGLPSTPHSGAFFQIEGARGNAKENGGCDTKVLKLKLFLVILSISCLSLV